MLTRIKVVTCLWPELELSLSLTVNLSIGSDKPDHETTLLSIFILTATSACML